MITTEEAMTEKVFHGQSPQRHNGECYVYVRFGPTKITRNESGREGWRLPLSRPGALTLMEEVWEGSAVRFHSESACPFGFKSGIA